MGAAVSARRGEREPEARMPWQSRRLGMKRRMNSAERQHDGCGSLGEARRARAGGTNALAVSAAWNEEKNEFSGEAARWVRQSRRGEASESRRHECLGSLGGLE